MLCVVCTYTALYLLMLIVHIVQHFIELVSNVMGIEMKLWLYQDHKHPQDNYLGRGTLYFKIVL